MDAKTNPPKPRGQTVRCARCFKEIDLSESESYKEIREQSETKYYCKFPCWYGPEKDLND